MSIVVWVSLLKPFFRVLFEILIIFLVAFSLYAHNDTLYFILLSLPISSFFLFRPESTVIDILSRLIDSTFERWALLDKLLNFIQSFFNNFYVLLSGFYLFRSPLALKYFNVWLNVAIFLIFRLSFWFWDVFGFIFFDLSTLILHFFLLILMFIIKFFKWFR